VADDAVVHGGVLRIPSNPDRRRRNYFREGDGQALTS
jgi:hypothetical protein